MPWEESVQKCVLRLEINLSQPAMGKVWSEFVGH